MQKSTSRSRTNAAGLISALLAVFPLSATLSRPACADAASSEPAPPKSNAVAEESSVAPSEEKGCAARVAARVQSYYDEVVDFEASFEQVTRSITFGSASLGADAPSRGFVQFAKPGNMRWQYLTPAESLVVSNGRVLWIYDPVAREAQRLPVTKDYLTGAALQFLLGDGQLLKEFDVSAPTCEQDSEGTLVLNLMPRRSASYETLGLRARVATGEIRETLLVDLFGNETSISFSDMRINQAPAPETFEFEKPDGVEVIDLVVGP